MMSFGKFHTQNQTAAKPLFKTLGHRTVKKMATEMPGQRTKPLVVQSSMNPITKILNHPTNNNMKRKF